MPWKTEKRGDRYAVVKKGTGKLVAMHPNAAAAEAQVRALYANYNGPQGPKYKRQQTAASYRARNAATRRIQSNGPKKNEEDSSDAPYFSKQVNGNTASYMPQKRR